MMLPHISSIEASWAEPDNNQSALIAYLDSAECSIKITIYQINLPNILSALLRAKERGIHIQIIINGQNSLYVAQSFATRSFLEFRQKLLAGSGAGKIETHWSSNNMLFNHIKSIIIDIELLSSSQAVLIVLTGNLFSQPSYNNQRDFGFAVKDTAAIIEAARVFESDFAPVDRDNTNNLFNSQTGLLWSNGSTNNDSQQYPQQNRYLTSVENSTIQGNARSRLTQFITDSCGSMDIYWEDFSDLELLALLIKRVQEGLEIRILINTISLDHPGVVKFMCSLSQAGAEVFFFDFKVLYIHAKTYISSNSEGRSWCIAGSQNPFVSSLNQNRELGIFTYDCSVIDLIQDSFNKDWAKAVDGAGTNPENITANDIRPSDSNSSNLPINNGIADAGFLCGEEIDIYSLTPMFTSNKKDC